MNEYYTGSYVGALLEGAAGISLFGLSAMGLIDASNQHATNHVVKPDSHVAAAAPGQINTALVLAEGFTLSIIAPGLLVDALRRIPE